MSGENCSGCLGKTLHHTCGKEPDADIAMLRAELAALREENAWLKEVVNRCWIGAQIATDPREAVKRVIENSGETALPSTHRLVPVERLREIECDISIVLGQEDPLPWQNVLRATRNWLRGTLGEATREEGPRV